MRILNIHRIILCIDVASVLETLARNRYVTLELDRRVYPVLAQQPSVFGLR